MNIGQIILAGDYNDILSKIDTKKLYQSKKFDKPVHNLKSMIKLHNLIDIWNEIAYNILTTYHFDFPLYRKVEETLYFSCI